MHDILFAFLKKKRWFQELLYRAIFNKERGYDKNTGAGKRISGPGLLQDNRERGCGNPASP